jgi:hypothetical protein
MQAMSQTAGGLREIAWVISAAAAALSVPV